MGLNCKRLSNKQSNGRSEWVPRLVRGGLGGVGVGRLTVHIHRSALLANNNVAAHTSKSVYMPNKQERERKEWSRSGKLRTDQ